jgi:hypothetical protein
MELVKKNIISVICGAVAIIAIVASFFPLGGYVADLQKSLDTSKSTYSTLDGLRTKSRTLPVTKLDEATTPAPLTIFPNPEVIEKAGAVVKQVEGQSIKMRDAAIAMNKKKQLVEGALPEPRPPLDIRFRDRYVALLSPPLTGPNMQASGEPCKLLKDYKAGVLPNAQLIEQEKARLQAEILNTRVQKNAQGQVINQPELTDLAAQVAIEVPQRFKKAVAEKSLFYVESPGAGGASGMGGIGGTGGPLGATLDMAPGIAGNGRPRPDSIWWAQVALWIQTDVLEAVKEANTTKDPLTGKVPANLMEAPVKRLIKVNVPMVNSFIVAPGAAPAAPPADPNAAADTALTKTPQVSPTGRASNGMFDVVQFRIDADIETDKIPQFIRTLSHNRLMSVLRVELKGVDAEQAELAGYYYGKDAAGNSKPVSTVTMDCEALLLRSWTIPLMPRIIRTQLAIPDPPAPTPAAAPAPQAAAR